MTRDAWRRRLARIALVVLSVAAGIAGVGLTGELFDQGRWCCFHSWAMAHGTWPLVFLPSYRLTFHAGMAAGARLGLLDTPTRKTWIVTASLVIGPLALALWWLRVNYG
jgi:hypothetical protein